MLRANGFRKTASDRPMTAEDAEEFNRRRMRVAHELPASVRGCRARGSRPRLVSRKSDLLVKNLEEVAKYVKAALEDWEGTGGEVMTGARLSVSTSYRGFRRSSTTSTRGSGKGLGNP